MNLNVASIEQKNFQMVNAKNKMLSLLSIATFTKSHKNIFDDIYLKGRWGKALNSATGSTLEESVGARRALLHAIRYSERSPVRILDAACGDMQWMPSVLKEVKRQRIDYTGNDVSSVIIDVHMNNHNLTNFFREANIAFRFTNHDMNVISMDNYDIILIRHVIMHMEEADIMTLLEKLKKQNTLVLISSLTGNHPNNDIRDGEFHLVNLFTAPYNVDKSAIVEHTADKDSPLVLLNTTRMDRLF